MGVDLRSIGPTLKKLLILFFTISLLYLRSRHNEGSIKHHTLKKVRMPKHTADCDHPTHRVPDYEEGQVGVLVLHVHAVVDHVIHIVIDILYIDTFSLTATMPYMIVTKC